MPSEDHTSSLQSSYFEPSPSPEDLSSNDRSSNPLVLYNPPTVFSILRTAAINLFLPFVNGLMLGFGELFAHELAFRWGWGTTRIFPETRLQSRRPVGPGVEVRDNKQAEKLGIRSASLEDLTSLE